MPANNQDAHNDIRFAYIFDEGVEGRDIFADGEDYQTFLGYLMGYLSAAANTESLKMVFVVKGQSFSGLPRQPKNYLNRIELSAYRLKPNCFHLLLRELEEGVVERFMRSLLTRYSIYFNKKYQRSGGLFSGPYKLRRVSDHSKLRLLSYFMHHESLENKRQSVLDIYSSYADYLGLRKTFFVKTGIILSLFGGVTDYQSFIERDDLKQDEKALLETMVFGKSEAAIDSGKVLAPSRTSSVAPVGNAKSDWSGLTAFLTSAAIFLVLLGLGVRNVWEVQAREGVVLSSATSAPRDDPVVLVASDSAGPRNDPDSLSSPEVSPAIAASPSSNPPLVVVLRAKIKAGLTDVNLRRGPSVQSEKVGTATGGESFEFVAENGDWYEIKFADGSTGFVAASFAELLTENLEGLN